MQIQSIASISEVPRNDWQQLARQQYPFLDYDFLHALEFSGSVGNGTGWIPHHFVIYDKQQLIAALPGYIKQHSQGEYVFDWAWADAYARSGIDYFPKLLSAIPFTPVCGPRFIQHPQASVPLTSLLQAIKASLRQLDASSWHLLFPLANELEAWRELGLCCRKGVQFHWFNRGYRNFNDYLQIFTSRKRKNINKERRRIHEQGIDMVRIPGRDITQQQLQEFYTFYQATYFKHGQLGYLSAAFFQRLLDTMPNSLFYVFARARGKTVAAAFFMQGGDTLYGRYWGCLQEYDKLHFETCYYQGIEYCIEQGLTRFDPGAQGEHKIARGFEPVPTCSLHYISHPGFSRAIHDFVSREQTMMDHYEQEMRALLPFKKVPND